jgi:hypothetical protein
MPATASASLRLALAGEEIVLAGEPAWQDVLLPRYAAFVAASGEVAAASVRVSLHASAPAPADWPALEQLLAVPPQTSLRDGRLRWRSPALRLELDVDARRGHLEGPLHRLPIDLLVRLALPLLLAPDGLVLHGALVADAQGAWICGGPSGCGKSTLAALLGARSYCDELAAVRRDGDGWCGWSLPFWHGRPTRRPLAGIHLLRHGERHERRRLSHEEALRRLLREVVWPVLPEEAVGPLAALAELVRVVPVWELAFRPDAGVWDVLSREVAA